MLARNLAWTLPGNVVGGGLVVGLGYAWIGRREPAPARDALAVGPGSRRTVPPADGAVPVGAEA
jgi:hypothetical protein